MAGRPDLSVIIVTFRSRRDIDACLDSVRDALVDVASEIVVVDNASGDGTAEQARTHAGVTVIALDRNTGFGAGINAGLAATSGRYVLWVNPDGRMLGGRVADVLSWMDAHPDAGIIGGKVLDPGGTVQLSARSFPSYDAALGHRYSPLTRWFPNNPWSRRYLRTERAVDAVTRVDWVSGAFLLHRREVSDRLDGLDERFFMYVEDVDFCRRATDAGWTVWYHPGMVMEHAIGGSSRQVNRPMIIERHRSMWRYYQKHFHRFWLKDAVTWLGIWGRCGWLWMTAGLRR
ncbi:MAG: putative dTDP-rhamnosyltransferase [Acidimicrobiia bacterium]